MGVGAPQLRVLVLVTSTDRRGAETEGRQLADELTGLGHIATCVALAPGAVGGLGVDVLGRSALSPRTLWRLRSASSGVDVVLAYGSTTLPACALALLGSRTPFVYRSIGDPAQWVRDGWHRRRTGWLFRRAARVVALWPAAAHAITDLYGVQPDAVVVIPNARPDVPDGPGPAPAQRAVGFVGLSPEKEPLVAVAAVAATDGVRLVIAGDGPMKDLVLRACERSLEGRHEYVGVVDDMDEVWRRVDALLVTSRTEGMPGVVIEAGLRGIPTVAPDVGGLSSLIEEGVTGRLLTAGSRVSEFADAVDDALITRVSLGEAARVRMREEFVWPVVVHRWLALISAVASGRAR